MAISVVEKKIIDETKNNSSNQPNKGADAKPPCPTKPPMVIVSCGFYDEKGKKISGVDKEGNVLFKIVYKNPDGMKVLVDGFETKDIELEYNKEKITDAHYLELSANEKEIELFAKFKK